MSLLATAAVLCQSVIEWAERVKALKPQCNSVRGQVQTLMPLLGQYADELARRERLGQRLLRRQQSARVGDPRRARGAALERRRARRS